MSCSTCFPKSSMANAHLTRRALLGGLAGMSVAAGARARHSTPVTDAHIPSLRIGVSTLEAGLDGLSVSSAVSAWLATLAFDSPMRWNSENRVIAGVFAPIGRRGSRSAEFEVRQGAFFADRSPVTADTAVAALETMRSGEHGWRLQDVESIRALSPTVFELELARTNVSLPATMAHPALALRTVEGSGSGPFIRTDEAHYVRNPLFWQIGRPRVDALELVAIPDDVQRSTAAAMGEIDILPNVPLLDVPMLQHEPTVYLVGGPTNILCHLQLNLNKAELANVEVRRVLSAAINRSRLIQVAAASQAEATSTLFAPDLWTTGVPDIGQLSSEDVRTRLQELGVPSDLRLHLLADNADATLANTAVVLQEQLASCGISLSIALLEGQDLKAARSEGDFDLVAEYSPAWRDPHELVWPMLSTGGALNLSGYRSVEVDTLLRAAISLPDQEFRRGRYSRLEMLVQRDAPVIPLFRPYVWSAVRSTYPGYQALPPETSRGLLTLTATEQPRLWHDFPNAHPALEADFGGNL